MIILGGRLLETENKRKCQISCLKSGHGRLRNVSSGRLQERFWNSIWLRNKTVIYKVVAYGRWSLTRSGRYERVDCTFERYCTLLLPFGVLQARLQNTWPIHLHTLNNNTGHCNRKSISRNTRQLGDKQIFSPFHITKTLESVALVWRSI